MAFNNKIKPDENNSTIIVVEFKSNCNIIFEGITEYLFLENKLYSQRWIIKSGELYKEDASNIYNSISAISDEFRQHNIPGAAKEPSKSSVISKKCASCKYYYQSLPNKVAHNTLNKKIFGPRVSDGSKKWKDSWNTFKKINLCEYLNKNKKLKDSLAELNGG